MPHSYRGELRILEIYLQTAASSFSLNYGTDPAKLVPRSVSPQVIGITPDDGTWLVAAVYYAENLDSLSSVLNGLDADDASSIGIVQQIVGERSLKYGLSFMRAYLAFLPEPIEKLESKRISLVKSTKRVPSKD